MISVILCTHNPRADYLDGTLAALRGQTLGLAAWEFILVDNASAEPLANRVDLAWHPAARLAREEELGLTSARLTGIRQAQGDLLVFVDDDNVLDPDYLEQAQIIAQDRPFLGGWSGQCRPRFDAAPPEWTRRYWGNLAIREFDADAWSNLPRLADTMPCGAGLCVRKEAALRYLHLHETGLRPVRLDRAGNSLLSGGDNDLAACACDIGLGIGIVTSLRLTHLIPPERLTEDYLARLIEGIYVSAVVLADMRSAQPELASYHVRWHEPLRAILQRRPHRRMQLASIRGRRRGLEFLRNPIFNGSALA
jgi:glycosyltransferase involved in cell wall biosynthesis